MSKPYSIQLVRLEGVATVAGDLKPGAWLVSCDVDAYDGRGETVWDSDPTAAMRFAEMLDAVLYYRRQSTVLPIRADGKPNRPCTAFTVQVCLNPAREQ